MTIPSANRAQYMCNKYQIKLRTTPKVPQKWFPTEQEIEYLHTNPNDAPSAKAIERRRKYVRYSPNSTVNTNSKRTPKSYLISKLIDYCAKNGDSPFEFITLEKSKKRSKSKSFGLDGIEKVGEINCHPILLQSGGIKRGLIHTYFKKYVEAEVLYGDQAKQAGLSLKAYLQTHAGVDAWQGHHLEKSDILQELKKTKKDNWKSEIDQDEALIHTNGRVRLVMSRKNRLITAYYLDDKMREKVQGIT